MHACSQSKELFEMSGQHLDTLSMFPVDVEASMDRKPLPTRPGFHWLSIPGGQLVACQPQDPLLQFHVVGLLELIKHDESFSAYSCRVRFNSPVVLVSRFNEAWILDQEEAPSLP